MKLLLTKNPLDFVLWKPADADDDASSVFQSPWGNGRPGWHIECSAMSSKYLGANFDIHGGGADLQFPHHENEIAQSRCANEKSNFANYWIHNGFLTVNGEKMSKSLKNFITVKDLLDKEVSGVTIRFLLLSTHYRKPFDFNQKALDEAQKTLEKFYAVLDKKMLSMPRGKVPNHILECLTDDLNISKAIAILHEMAKKIKSVDDQNLKEELLATLDLLGLVDEKFFDKKNIAKNDENKIDEEYVNSQIELRIKFKQEKNFAKADEIRQNLLAQGIILEDIAKDKTIWKN